MGKYLDLIDSLDARMDAAVESSEAAQPEHVIEATFRPAAAPSQEPAIEVEFPPCPKCGQHRYWLGRGGKVMCGSKTCYSAVRFILTSVEYHAIN